MGCVDKVWEGKGRVDGRREGAVQVQVRAGADMEVDVDVDGCRAGWALKAGKAMDYGRQVRQGHYTTDRTDEAPKSTGREIRRVHQAREIVCVWERVMEKGGKGHLNE